jgi:hypothetical protein
MPQFFISASNSRCKLKTLFYPQIEGHLDQLRVALSHSGLWTTKSPTENREAF